MTTETDLRQILVAYLNYIEETAPFLSIDIPIQTRIALLTRLYDTSNPLSLQDALLISQCAGPLASVGFPYIEPITLQFPYIHLIQMQSRIGWHAFSTTINTDKYTMQIVVNITTYALVSPPLARLFTWTDIENTLFNPQITVGIMNKIDNTLSYFQLEPDIYKGGTNNVIYNHKLPFYVQIYDNNMNSIITFKSLSIGDLLPMDIQAFIPKYNFEMDGRIDKAPMFLQGNAGCYPCNAGMGTYYYSYPQCNGHFKIKYNNDNIMSTSKVWFDHEWGNFDFNPSSKWMRLALRFYKPELGWLWFGLQLNNGYSLSFYNSHPIGVLKYDSKDKEGQVITPCGEIRHCEIRIEILTISTFPTDLSLDREPIWYPHHIRISYIDPYTNIFNILYLQPIMPFATPNHWITLGEANESRVTIYNRHMHPIGQGNVEGMLYITKDELNRRACEKLQLPLNTQLIM